MDYIRAFTNECASRGLTAHTIQSYVSCLKYFLQRYPEPAAISLDDLRAFLGELRARDLNGSTLKGYFAAISALFDFLVLEGALGSNPIPSFRKRYLRIKNQYGGENTRQLISIQEMSRLVSLANGDILAKTIMLFLAKTGLRRGELIAMDLGDINLEMMQFTIKPKRKRSNRAGFFDNEMQAVMYEYLDWRKQRALDNALWVSEEGKRISRNSVYYTVIDYAELAGLHDPCGALNKKFTPHCFRHFFVTMLRRAGMPREYIKELRGDRRKEAIDIYDHIDPEELRKSYLRYIPSLSIGPGRQGTLEKWIEPETEVKHGPKRDQ